MDAAVAPVPSPSSRSGLDWLNFFIANVQTGFGPFIAVYLTTERWTQVDIGLVLTVSGAFALLGQVPAGVLVDAMASKRLAAAVAATGIAGSALTLAVWPIFPLVLLAELLHGAASCLMTPAIAAISLGLVRRAEIGERLGRNGRFASIGNGLAAALMGACGRLISNRAVFFLTAALAIPALVALRYIKPAEIDPVRARGGMPEHGSRKLASRLHGIVDNKPLLIFGGCLVLFHLANGAMLPLMASVVTTRSREWATVLIAACIVVPQLLVAVLSPWIGRQAEAWGRRPLLLLGFAALSIRGAFFIFVTSPYLLVPVQILDGVSAAVLGVMLPLVVADVTRGTGRFNAALGVAGTAGAIGAALSTTLAGYVSDGFGNPAAFACLAGIAAAAALLVAGPMPETRPTRD
ncbi:MAG TPA: MFS transporter [Stellaceae bacterium]|nr:MFS transporter [Stellaceae bacterium]